MDLHMVKSTDVLTGVAALKAGPFTVGFAAETENLEAQAQAKLEQKNLDMIVGNLVGQNLGFDCDNNSVIVLWPDGRASFNRMPKSELAVELVTIIAERYNLTEHNNQNNAPTPLRQPTTS